MSNESKLESLEEVDFDDFVDSLEATRDAEGKIAPPESKIAAREWVLAYNALTKENEFLKDEYLVHLIATYITPVKEKIEKNKEKQDLLKDGFYDFLDSIEEDKVCFPDIGTIYKKKIPPKVIYPEDEKELLEKLIEEKSEYVRTKYEIDKAKILAYYKENGDIPVDGLVGEREAKTVVVKRPTEKKD